MSERTSVVIAHSSESVRHTLKDAFKDQPDLQLVGEACEEADAVWLIERAQPAVALIEGCLPDRGAVLIGRELARSSPATALVIINSHDEVTPLCSGLAGGRGIVPAELDGAGVVRALRAVGSRTGMACSGCLGIASPQAEALARRGERRTCHACGAGEIEEARSALTAALGAAEVEVFDAMTAGRTNAEIADLMELPIEAIERHVHAIVWELGMTPAARESRAA